MGSEQQWDDLGKEWQSVLNERKRKPLHMAGLRWKKHDQTLLAKLGPLPDKHGLTRIMGAVLNADYRECVEGRMPDQVAVPYFLAMQVCIAHVLRHRSHDDEIDFIFEEQARYSKSAQAIYDAVHEFHGDSELHLSHVRKNDHVGLQAADFLAFQLGQYLSDPGSKKSRWGMSILGDGNITEVKLQKHQVRRMVQAYIAAGR
jgi:hypothetical protein